MDERKLEFRTGLAVVIGLIILAGLVLFSGGLRFLRDYYTLKVHFESAAGVKPGAPVRMSGVEIGKVESIAFRIGPDRRTYIEMVLQIEKGYPVSTDADIAITADSLLSERILEITPGTTQAYLAAGETVPKMGSTPKSMDEAFSMIPPIVDSLKKSVDNLNLIIADPKVQSDIRRAIEGVANTASSADGIVKKLTSFFDENKASISETISNVNETSKNVKELSAKFEGISNEVTDTVKLFKSEFEKFTKNINNPELFAKVEETVNKFSKLPDKVEELIASVKKLSDDDAHGVMEKASKILEELYVTVTRLSNDTQEIMGSVKATLLLTREGDGIIAALLTDRALTAKVNDMVDQGIFLLEHPIMFMLKGGYKKRKEPPAEQPAQQKPSLAKE